MNQRILLTAFLSFSFYLLSSQIPAGFNYQAIARDGSGTLLINQPLEVKIAIQSLLTGGNLIWEEQHSVTTDKFGVMSFVVGTKPNLGGSAAAFSDINWGSQAYFLKTSIQIPGESFTEMGTTQLWSVPYSMVSKEIGGSLKKLSVKGSTTNMEEALFEVKNANDQIVFAVYNEGVRIYVDDGDKKGVKGGFAIGGFGLEKGSGTSQKYFYVSSDSIRAYIYDNPALKENKPRGGFAVGGFDGATGTTNEYLVVSPDSVRVYLDDAPSTKGPKGGFAIGGFVESKGFDQKYLSISTDSIRMYIDDRGKASKGGFAIGGFDLGKGGSTSFLNVATDAGGKIDPPQNRVLWYPLKNALLAGNVLIKDPIDVGENSFASGFQSRAKGNYSQALGYKASTEGVSATAIGNYAFAQGNNSFALGDSAFVLAEDGYAIGAGTLVTGRGSFAIGSKDRFFGDNFELSTSATGVLSMAMGLDADAEGMESFASGIGVKARGANSVAMGRSSIASGDFSMALKGTASGTGSISIGGGSSSGLNSLTIGLGTSSGWGSVVIGDGHADNYYSISLGYDAYASGKYAMAVGSGSTAQAYGSFVIGSYNKISGNKETLIDTDPLFIIGNGTYITPSNAFTVLRNGRTAIGHDNPSQMLDVNGQVRIRGGNPALGRVLTSAADGTATWENIGTHLHSAADITSGTLLVSRGGTGLSTLTASKVLVGNGTSSVLQPSNLHWDNVNSRLGILNTVPAYNIDITGSARITQSAYLATAGGNVGIGTIAPAYDLDVVGSAQVSQSAYLATSSGSVGIGTTAPGTYRLKVSSSATGLTSSAGFFENTNASGIALKATTNSTDGTALFIQEGAGYSLRCDGYDPNFFVAFAVKGRNVGIGNSNPGEKLDITAGNGRVQTGYNWLTNSDIRYKKNITTLTSSLEKLMNLRGVRFDLAEDERVVDGSGKYIGFIAQELESMFPEFVVTESNGYKSVAYDKMSAVLVEAVKEQQKIIESQKAKIDGQETELESLKSRVEQIEALVNRISAK